jgi:hypothetical protein
MTVLRTGIVVGVLGVGLAGLLAADAMRTGDAQRALGASEPIHAQWNEVKWPFPIDQWGVGRAFQCRAADCGGEINLYLRAKLGFCNCATGVSDDAELDRVGDLDLLSNKFQGLRDGRPISVGWMQGRSRPFHVSIPYSSPRTALAIAFNDKCDVVVATVVADERRVPAAEQAALEFLNGDVVLHWAEKELGL